MDERGAIDVGRSVDWSKASADYARYRPGPPPSFYARLASFGVGLKGQRILDLGTGTGVLARQFAQQGALVAGIDVSEGQIAAARRLAAQQGLSIEFRIAGAEATPFADGPFDCLTANQCWLYFDKSKAIPEVLRLLAPGGVLVTSHFSWLPRLDPVARASEGLILKYNPQWSAGDWSGELPSVVEPAAGGLTQRALFWYDEAIAFTRETWRGRIRANRGVGAALSDGEVIAFDAEHDALLRQIVPDSFTVRHRIDARFFGAA